MGDKCGLLRRAQLPARPASVDPTSVRWKFRYDREAVGPRCPWYRELYSLDPYGFSAADDRRKKHICPIFIPGQSLLGRVATLLSSSVTCPENPGSMKPAVECVRRPSRPSELLPSSRAATSSGRLTSSNVDPSTNSPGCRMNAWSGSTSTNRVSSG